MSQVKNIGLKTSGLGLKTLGLGLKHPIFFSPEPQALSPIFWGNEVSQVKNIGLKTSGLGLKTLGLGLKHPIFFSPEPQALSPSSSAHFLQPTVFSPNNSLLAPGIIKAGKFFDKNKVCRSSWAVALLGNDEFGQSGIFFGCIVHFVTIDKTNHVGILFD